MGSRVDSQRRHEIASTAVLGRFWDNPGRQGWLLLTAPSIAPGGGAGRAADGRVCSGDDVTSLLYCLYFVVETKNVELIESDVYTSPTSPPRSPAPHPARSPARSALGRIEPSSMPRSTTGTPRTARRRVSSPSHTAAQRLDRARGPGVPSRQSDFRSASDTAVSRRTRCPPG